MTPNNIWCCLNTKLKKLLKEGIHTHKMDKEERRIYGMEYYKKNRDKLREYMRSRAKLTSDDSPGKIAGIKAAIKRLDKKEEKSEEIMARVMWLKKELKRLEKLKK